MKENGKITVALEHIDFAYEKKGEMHQVLEDVSYEFESGKMYAIMGKSGAGKTTTLSLLGALDFPQKGQVLYCGEEITKKNQEKYRNEAVSMIFQDYNLLTYLNGYQNIALAMHITGKKEESEQIGAWLEKVGIDERTAKSNVKQISGGEQQRIAIARTLATNSKVILADEPTGNLDEETANEIIELLYRLAHEENKCVIVVTHTKELAKKADMTLRISDKKITEG